MAQSNIGKYQVLEEIAAGRQGVVYRAFDPEAGQIVALKVLHASLTGDLSYAERFRREASLTASINHPNVVKIFEVGQDGDRHFMALELLPENLARIIESGGQMLIDRAAEFCVQIAKGLAAAHALGIVHRDVKPQNVLIGQDGTAKVTDFGIARAEELSTMTATGTVMGTPHYMSPEQAQGERADARSDVYSLGCMLYQMLVGEVPFKGDTPLAVVRQHVDQKPRPLQALRQNLPRELVSVVERAMAKSPARRFQSASEMADALRAAVPGVATARPAEPPSPPEPPRDRGAAAPPRPTPEAPRGDARRLSRPRSVARISAALVLLLWGLFLFAPSSGQASKGVLVAAVLFASSSVATLSAAFLMLRRTKFKIGRLGWGPLAALLIVMGFVLFVAANAAGPEADTTPEGGPEAVALAPPVARTHSPTPKSTPAQSQSSILSAVETPAPTPNAAGIPTPTAIVQTIMIPTPTATPRPAEIFTTTITSTPAATPAPPTFSTLAPVVSPPLTPTPKRVILVTKTADTDDGRCDADCSLREAIQAAGSGDKIVIPPGTYTSGASVFVIEKNLVLAGSGADITIIQAAKTLDEATPGVLQIGPSATVNISGVTIQHGKSMNRGGGIYTSGTLALIDSMISRNEARIQGGGIHNGGGTLALINSIVSENTAKIAGGISVTNAANIAGKLTVTNSTVSDNNSGAGGGILSDGGEISATDSSIINNYGGASGGGIHNVGGTLTLIRSTVSGNRALDRGGGILSDGRSAKLTLKNSTVSGNTADVGGGIHSTGALSLANSTIVKNHSETGGGVYQDGPTASLINTIIAGNVASNGADCSGDFASLGHNLVGDGLACEFRAATGDQVGFQFGVDPQLGPLQDNGGPTETHALLSGSPAIDAGDDGAAPSTDQRGVVRPQGSASDVGSYESPFPAVPAPTPTPTPTLVPNSPVVRSVSPWPMIAFDQQHSGRSPHTGPDRPTELWKFEAKGEPGSPVLGPDGRVYFGASFSFENPEFLGAVYALDAQGLLRWFVPVQDFIGARSPALASDSTIYVGSSDGLRALGPTGSLIWSTLTDENESPSGPTVGLDGTIYVGVFDQQRREMSGRVIAARPDGSLKWTFPTDGFVTSPPAIGRDGTVYASAWNPLDSSVNRIYAITPDGALRWSIATTEMVISPRAIGLDDVIYANANDGTLYAVNPNGSVRWTYSIPGNSGASPALGLDDTIYVGSDDHRLYAIGADGSLKWTFLTGDQVGAPASVDADGTIYVGSWDHSLYAINTDGTLKWSFPTGGIVASAPAIGIDGMIFFGSRDLTLYALGEAPTSPLPVPTATPTATAQ